VQRFPASARSRRETHEADLVNVFGFLPGRRKDSPARTYVVSGHYDSRASGRFDATSFAPGADDDASGTAIVLEHARVMSQFEFEANLVFLCVSGEEQGLLGANHFAEQAVEDGLVIDGMITNDIVGGVLGGNGVEDAKTIRVFSGAEGQDSASRELARLVFDVGARYVPDARIQLIYRLDRYGRGGDHIPFHERGVPAVRFTEANEHYDRQHQDVREEDGVQYGDLPEFVSPAYMALVARVNAATLANLALAPPPPTAVELRGAMRYDALLRWQAADANAQHFVVWRETTSPRWELGFEPVGGDQFTAESVNADDHFLGVRSVNELGHMSRAVLP
jgi:Zn-dependent M28 family amino/carboxypeptidase